MGEEYQEIDLKELVGIILAKWWLILIFVGIAGGVSYYTTTHFITPMYESQATLFVGKESDAFGDFSLTDLQMDNKLVVDYRELLKTRLVTEKVIADLGLDVSTDQIVNHLSVSVVSDSRLIHIAFTDADPEVAAAIANRLSEVLVIKAEEIIGIQNVQILDNAIPVYTPISPNVTMNVAIACVLGFMLAIFVIFVFKMMNNTIEKEDRLEAELGIPVLGIIPKYGEVS